MASENDYHDAFAARLKGAEADPSVLQDIHLLRPSNTKYANLGDLIGSHPFIVRNDEILPTGHKLGRNDMLEDLGGNMRPDFGLRAISSKNESARIYIEVKFKSKANQGDPLNQYARSVVSQRYSNKNN